MTSEPQLLTVGQIADELHEPVTRVAYVVSKYRIKPVDRVGIIRRFDRAQITVIRQGLYGIRVGKHHV